MQILAFQTSDFKFTNSFKLHVSKLSTAFRLAFNNAAESAAPMRESQTFDVTVWRRIAFTRSVMPEASITADVESINQTWMKQVIESSPDLRHAEMQNSVSRSCQSKCCKKIKLLEDWWPEYKVDRFNKQNCWFFIFFVMRFFEEILSRPEHVFNFLNLQVIIVTIQIIYKHDYIFQN